MLSIVHIIMYIAPLTLLQIRGHGGYVGGPFACIYYNRGYYKPKSSQQWRGCRVRNPYLGNQYLIGKSLCQKILKQH